MDNLRTAKLSRVMQVLYQYTDPQPRYSGMSTLEVAEFILKAIEDVEFDDNIRFNELNVIEQKQEYNAHE